MTPVAAWKSIVEDPAKRASYTTMRGHGGFVRASWDEVERDHRRRQRLHGEDLRAGPRLRLLADPGHVDGLLRGRLALPVADRRRLHVVLRLVLRPAAGLAADLGRADRRSRNRADWYNAGFIILWGSNVPQTRTPDAHFYTEARYRGMKSAVICPDYSEASKFGDIWLSVKQGTDAALAMAMGHVILKEYHVDRQAPYFRDYVRQYTDMPMLVKLVQQGGRLVPDRFLRASDFDEALGESNNPDWKTVAFDETTGEDRRAARLGRLPLGRDGQVEPRGEGSPAARRRRCGCRSTTSRTTSPRSPSPISATSSTSISPTPTMPASSSAACR